MVVSVLSQALVRWQYAAGPFWPYVCAAPFLSTGDGESLVGQMGQVGDRGRLAVSQRVRTSKQRTALAEKLQAVVQPSNDLVTENGVGASPSPAERAGPPPVDRDGTSRPGCSVVLVDLPPLPILQIAPLLSERGWWVVPVMGRWISSPAVLPCRRMIELLVRGAWQVRRPPEPRGVLLIADGERFGPVGYPALAPGRSFDNRYEYQICRFPSTRLLQDQGVQRVNWITAERPASTTGDPLGEPTLGLPPVARDLHPYREGLVRDGISVEVTVWQLR